MKAQQPISFAFLFFIYFILFYFIVLYVILFYFLNKKADSTSSEILFSVL